MVDVMPMGEADRWVELLSNPETRDLAIHKLRRILICGLSATLCKRYSSTLDPEDIAQDAIVKILESMDTFRGECRCTTWSMTIATRIGINELRSRRFRDVSLNSLTEDGVLVEREAPKDAVGHNHDWSLLQAGLADVISSKLSDRQQVAVRALLKGMPIEVVAEKVGCNRNAVYKLFHDARVKLRAGLEQSGFDQDEVIAIVQSQE